MKTLLLSVLLIGFAVAQETKIDSVAIMEKIDSLNAQAEKIAEVANIQIGQINFAVVVLADMLIPKEIEEDSDE